jgi:hypothetical protein
MIDIINNKSCKILNYINYGRGDGCNTSLFSHTVDFGEGEVLGNGSGNGSFTGYGMGYGTGNIAGNGYGTKIIEVYY